MPDRPNLLLIHCHDLGRHLGCYGVPSVQTPAIDALAGSGVLFQNHFCTSPGCSPSRAALWTGLFPHQTGVYGLTHGSFGWRMKPDCVHLAQRLTGAGYRTALAGGFHEDRTRERLGYQEFTQPDTANGFAPAREVADSAIGFLDASHEAEEPFFLSVGFFEPHRPFDYGGVSPDDAAGCWIPPYIPQETGAQREAATRDFRALQGAIREVDHQIGRLLGHLDQTGKRDSTVVILSTDHGLPMPRAKCSLSDPGIECALLLRAPFAGLDPGQVATPLCSNIDVVPTVLDLLGLPVPEDLPGLSLRPALRGVPWDREAIFAEKTYHRTYDPMRCIRTGRWKCIINFEFNTCYDAPSDILESPIFTTSPELYTTPRPAIELYDLAADPQEQNNLAGDPRFAGIQNDLLEKILLWMRETDDALLHGDIASPFARDLRQSLPKLSR